jgi:hypothetical protein
MKRKYWTMAVVALASLALLAGPAEAQKKRKKRKKNAPEFKLGAQGAFVTPLGDWGKFSGVGFGALLNLDVSLGKKMPVVFTARTGYVHMTSGTIETVGGRFDTPSIGMIPILVGAKYHMPFMKSLYGAAELGPNIMMAGSVQRGDTTIEGDTSVKFAMTLGAGYLLKDFDFRLFMLLPDIGDAWGFGITAGYNFVTF